MSIRKFVCLLPVLCLAFTSCVSRGFPTHGGGKRFWHEQEIVSKSIDSAVAELNLTERINALGTKPKTVGLLVHAMADSGGGVQATSGGFTGAIGGLFGAGGDLGGAPAAGFGGASYTTPQTVYGSFAFSSSEDLAYLRGKVIEQLADARVGIGKADEVDGVVYVLVDQLGIDRRDLNILIYNKYDLRARARMKAFYVQLQGGEVVDFTDLRGGTGEWHYVEDYIFGIGPLRPEAASEVSAEYGMGS